MPTKRDDVLEQQAKADVPTEYANNMAAQISPYDMSLVFGLRMGDGVEPKFRVVMSLEHAMVMLMVLRRAMREHVKSSGVTLELPEALLREMQLNEESPLW